MIEALGGILALKLQPIIDTIAKLKADNQQKSHEILEPQSNLKQATQRIEEYVSL